MAMSMVRTLFHLFLNASSPSFMNLYDQTEAMKQVSQLPVSQIDW